MRATNSDRSRVFPPAHFSNGLATEEPYTVVFIL